MAETVIALAIERITDLLIYEANFLRDVKEEVESLKAELERMRSFLKDVDRKQEQDKRLRTRVMEIRDLAYDAEDAIDSYILEVACRKGFNGIINRFMTIFTKPFNLHKIGKQVKAIQTKLGDVSRSFPAYGILGEGDQGSSSAVEMQRWLRRSYPHVEEEVVVSLEVSTRDVMEQLMKEADQDRLHVVVSIVGMGGIGKTTLAKKVFNHNDVKRHFDCCAWVFISQQFMPREVLHGLLTNILSPSRNEIKKIDKLKEDELVEMLSNVLKEKRYLLVLDDIWRCEDWDCLKPAFPKGKKGSRLLFTTRNKEVALFADPCSFPIEIPFLTEDESWKLLRRKAFPEGKMGHQARSNEFEMIGKEMLKKCGGLPLAIAVLGGLLATKKSRNEWEMVHRNIKQHLNKFQQRDYHYGGVNWILALSYNELPFYLKPCFLYLGHYPEDWEISKKELIRLWIAEGFISASSKEGEVWIEDIAEQYLEELINRCLVQVGKRDHTGTGLKTCRLHDLLRDLCVLKSREENFLRIIHPSSLIETDVHSLHEAFTASIPRRIAIHLSRKYVCLNEQFPNLRSLLIFQDEGWIGLNISKCSNFRFLRVLKLLDLGRDSRWYSNIPTEIGNLFHLRYLALICSGVCWPQSIGRLKSLQTLYIQSYSTLLKIPTVLFKLGRLRHLITKHSHLHSHGVRPWLVIKGCGEVKSFASIETLKNVSVDNLIKDNPLLMLTNIRSLGIKFRRSKDVEAIMRSPCFVSDRLQSLHMELEAGYLFPNLEPLSTCHHLSKLSLTGKMLEDQNSSHGHVLKFLPKSITKLTLKSSQIKQNPMVVLEKLPHLMSLLLGFRSYEGTELYCSANGFPLLDYLDIRTSDVRYWQIEKGSMSRLRILKLYNVSQLRKVPKGLKHITTLEEMTLWYTKKSLAKRVQVIDGTEGEDYYKVSHIPSIKIFKPKDD